MLFEMHTWHKETYCDFWGNSFCSKQKYSFPEERLRTCLWKELTILLNNAVLRIDCQTLSLFVQWKGSFVGDVSLVLTLFKRLIMILILIDMLIQHLAKVCLELRVPTEDNFLWTHANQYLLSWTKLMKWRMLLASCEHKLCNCVKVPDQYLISWCR